MCKDIVSKVKKIPLLLFLTAYSTFSIANSEPFSTDSSYMFGDWRGTRTDLKNEGVDFQIGYTGEAASNISGGYNTSTTIRYADQWALGMNLDLEKLKGWSDTEFQVTITNRNGRNLSKDVVGNSQTGMLASSQAIWGRGQTTRLTQFWIRQGYFDHVLDVKVGRVTVGEDFDSLQSNFQNLSMGGGAVGNWRGDRWYNWPISQWGGRIKFDLTSKIYTQVGIYNQNPKNYDTGNGFHLNTNGSVGNLVPLEFGWLPTLGAAKLMGKYKIGGYYSSTKGDVYSSTILNSTGKQYSNTAHSYGGYILAQQQLTSVEGDTNRGLTLTAQAVINDKKTSEIDNFQSVALTFIGPFDLRPEDELGFGVGRIHLNKYYTNSLENKNMSCNNNVHLLIQDGSEYDYESYYRIKFTKWLSISPNLQYIHAPGAITHVKSAFVAGVMFNATL